MSFNEKMWRAGSSDGENMTLKLCAACGIHYEGEHENAFSGWQRPVCGACYSLLEHRCWTCGQTPCSEAEHKDPDHGF